MTARNRIHLNTKGIAPPKAQKSKKPKPTPHEYVNYGLNPLAIGGLWLLVLAVLFLLTEVGVVRSRPTTRLLLDPDTYQEELER